MQLVRILSSIAAVTLLHPLLPAYAEPYQSLFNRQALKDNPLLYCSDTAGQQAQNNKLEERQNNIHGQSSANAQSHQESDSANTSGSLSVGVMGKTFGGSVSHGHSRSESNAASNSQSSNEDTGSQHAYDRGTIKTEIIGKDCNAFNQAAAQRDIARMNYELMRRRDSTSLFHRVVGW